MAEYIHPHKKTWRKGYFSTSAWALRLMIYTLTQMGYNKHNGTISNFKAIEGKENERHSPESD